MPNHWITCPHCGEKRNTSGMYTSPANLEKDRQWWVDEHDSARCITEETGSEFPYQPGELRIVRSVNTPTSESVAYIVEEVALDDRGQHRRKNDELLPEKGALQLMRNLGSPYPGQRYDDLPFSAPASVKSPATKEATSDEQRFNKIKDRLIASTNSPGLTSFHDGHVHMTLGEWDGP